MLFEVGSRYMFWTVESDGDDAPLSKSGRHWDVLAVDGPLLKLGLRPGEIIIFNTHSAAFLYAEEAGKSDQFPKRDDLI